MVEIQTDEKNAGGVRLTFSGDLSVVEIGQIYEQLKTVKREAGQYHVVVNKVENLDLSFFQLLYAFLMEVKKGEIHLTWDLPDESERIMAESGLQSIFNQWTRN